MTWYNTAQCDFSDMFTVTSCAHILSNNVLFPALLFTIYIIAIIGMAFTGKSIFRSLTYAGYIGSMLSILLVIMNFLNPNFMYFMFLLTAIGVIGIKLSEAPS